MRPLTVVLLALLAAIVGGVLGLGQERFLRRRRLELPLEVETTIDRLRWVGAGVAITLAVKASVSAQPALVFAVLPLVAVGPWMATAQQVGVRTSDRLMLTTGFLTLNGVMLATAFTGRVSLLLSAATGLAAAAAVGVLAHWASRGAVSTAEVKLAALIGLACGALGLPAVGLVLAGAVGCVAVAWAAGRFRVHRVGPVLLAGAWVAGTLTL